MWVLHPCHDKTIQVVWHVSAHKLQILHDWQGLILICVVDNPSEQHVVCLILLHLCFCCMAMQFWALTGLKTPPRYCPQVFQHPRLKSRLLNSRKLLHKSFNRINIHTFFILTIQLINSLLFCSQLSNLGCWSTTMYCMYQQVVLDWNWDGWPTVCEASFKSLQVYFHSILQKLNKSAGCLGWKPRPCNQFPCTAALCLTYTFYCRWSFSALREGLVFTEVSLAGSQLDGRFWLFMSRSLHLPLTPPVSPITLLFVFPNTTTTITIIKFTVVIHVFVFLSVFAHLCCYM